MKYPRLLCIFLICLVAQAVVASSVTYRYYRFTPTKLRNNGAANSVQMAEFEFYLAGVETSAPTASNPGGNNPGGETPPNVVDGSLGTKWLDFNKGALIFDFGSPEEIDSYRWATANDAEERDPVRWTLEGSDNATSWTLLEDQTAADYPVTLSRQTYLPVEGLNQTSTTPTVEFTISDGAVTTESAVGVNAGEQVTLSWTTTDATSVTLDTGSGPQVVAANGSVSLNPTVTSIYFLSASNGTGNTDADVSAIVGVAMQAPVINEFLADASRDAELCDEDGDFSDWIELYNPNSYAIDAGGYFLTDDATLVTTWQLPAGVAMEPESYLVIYASNKNRAVAGAELHTSFSLSVNGEYLALIDPDGSTVVQSFSPGYPIQQTDVSYGMLSGGGFDSFSMPTPGAENTTPPGALAEDVIFLTPAQAFTVSISVQLDALSPNAVIRYTTNGDLPTETSAIYTGPLTINASTLVRARVFEAGFAPGKVKSEAYIRLQSAVANQTSDLPVVIIENFNGGGVPTGRDLQTAYFMLHEPDELTGITTLTDLPIDANRIGIKRRGSSTLNDPKGNYRVQFWKDGSDEEKNIRLLGLSDHDEWILFAPYNFDRSLVRIPFIHELSNDIGTYAPRTRLCEVYLNEAGSEVTSADCQGVYVLMERISRDNERVDVERLDKNDLTAPDVTGGYILSIDRLDPEDQGFAVP